jgi:hypothetical protein
MEQSVSAYHRIKEEDKARLERVSKNYFEPPKGEWAELTSLAYHAGLREGLLNTVTTVEQDQIINKVVALLQPAQWRVPSDFMTYQHYQRVVETIDMTSSPGYPYLLNYPTNASMFNYKEGVYDQNRIEQVWSMVLAQIVNRRVDPIRLFIKPEPHSRRKMELGRYRLISSVSVIDQIIDAMLFGEMNAAIIDNWLYTPVRVGWSPLNGGWRCMPYMTEQIAIDKSSWDWTAQGWLFDTVLQIRTRLCQTNTEKWLELASWRYKALFQQPWFVTSRGLLLQQKSPGVMKSGCFNTLIDNSIMQLILHTRCMIRMGKPIGNILVMGDDTLQDALYGDELDRYISILSECSIVKAHEYKLEFCGFSFHVSGNVEPVYRGKHAYKILYMNEKIASEMADSYALLYHRSKYRSLIRSLFERMGLRLRSETEAELIYG